MSSVIEVYKYLAGEQGKLFREQAKLAAQKAKIEAREKALKKAEEDQEQFIRQLLTQIEELAGENKHLIQIRDMYIKKELLMKEQIKSLMEARQK